MRENGCPDCDKLWEQYEKAVMAHTRLESKAKLAKLRYERQMELIDSRVATALAERHRLRQEILEHERNVHSATPPSFEA